MHILRTRRVRAWFAGLVGIAALSGAGIGLAAATAPAATADTTAATSTHGVPGTLPSTVSLTVLQPTPYQVITGPALPIQVLANGYLIDARYAGTPDSSFIGHYHEILDGNLVDMTPYRDGNRDQLPMVGVADGLHTLTLVPSNNDHTTVANAAVSIPFYYEGPYLPEPAGNSGSGTPSISISSPVNGSSVQGDSFTITADVNNFVFCGDCFGKALVAGEGHWHIFADQVNMPHMLTMGTGSGTSGTQVVSLKGITPGWHTFYALLVDNHHMPFMTNGMPNPGTLTSVRQYVQSAG